MNVIYDSNGITVEALMELVDDLGYEPTEYETKDVQQTDDTKENKKGKGGKNGTESEIGEREVQLEFSGINNRYVCNPFDFL
jgi:hypothetical protein